MTSGTGGVFIAPGPPWAPLGPPGPPWTLSQILEIIDRLINIMPLQILNLPLYLFLIHSATPKIPNPSWKKSCQKNIEPMQKVYYNK
jgi:hypothetical protein